MTWAAVAAAAVTVVGGAVNAQGQRKAANAQMNAADRAAAEARAERAPWQMAGADALQRLSTGLAPNGEFSKKFTMADATNSDAEQHALSMGTRAIENSAAAKGGLINSNALEDIQKFGQSNAASFQNQAFNQWLSQQNQQLGAVQSLAQVGQTQANLTADTNANAALARGGAQAASAVAQANNTSDTIGKLGNILGQSDIFKPSKTSTDPSTNQPIDDAARSPTYENQMDLSDERLKEDIVQVGTTNDGLPIYKYRMKRGGPVKMGVMAQHVERVRPDAVKKDRAGFRMVDYGKVT